MPISGSIKARGGFMRVLTHAEKLALGAGLLSIDDDSEVLFLGFKFRQFYTQYSITVGSTGNLGISIGIMSAHIGFRSQFSMLRCPAVKKANPRSHGVTVVEYEQDYGVVVEEGRKAAQSNPNCFFIDDENSTTLFFGYSLGQRLKKQFAEQGGIDDADHPLFVSAVRCWRWSCGVAFSGFKLAFGDDAHCVFAEPTHPRACC
ncbi:pyridoxal-phosphate dependent enzyme [Escherichia coli]